jgi:hypothetical protein
MSEPALIYAAIPISCECREDPTRRPCRYVAALWSHETSILHRNRRRPHARLRKCAGHGLVADNRSVRWPAVARMSLTGVWWDGGASCLNGCFKIAHAWMRHAVPVTPNRRNAGAICKEDRRCQDTWLFYSS